MRTTLFIAGRISLRNTDAENRRHFNPGVTVAVTGVAIAVMVMELTLAVVSGFTNNITRRVLGTQPTLTVTGAMDYIHGGTEGFITLTPELRYEFENDLDDVDLIPIISFTRPAVLKTPDDFEAIVMRAHSIGPTEFEKSSLIQGNWDDFFANPQSIVLSAYTANRLGVGIGDKVDVAFMINEAIKSRRPEVVGIYQTHFGDFDNTNALVPIQFLQQVEGVDSITGTSIDFYYPERDIEKISQSAMELQGLLLGAVTAKRIDKVFPVDNVAHTGAIYFNWLDLLDTNVVVVFILMIAVAAFTLISSLFIILLERIQLIGMLRSFGMKERSIRDIFILIGVRLVLMGMFWGNIVGLGIILLQRYFHILPLDPKMYYMSYVPMEPVWWQIIALNIGVIIVGYLVLVLPAMIVAKVKPAEVFRFE